MTGLVCTDWQQTLSLPLLVTYGSKLVFLGDDGVTGVLLCVCMTEREGWQKGWLELIPPNQILTLTVWVNVRVRAHFPPAHSSQDSDSLLLLACLCHRCQTGRTSQSNLPHHPKEKEKKSSYNFHPNAQSLANSSVIRCLQCPVTRMAVSCDI